MGYFQKDPSKQSEDPGSLAGVKHSNLVARVDGLLNDKVSIAIKELIDSGAVKLANYLNFYDLFFSAVNGASESTRIFLPPPPDKVATLLPAARLKALQMPGASEDCFFIVREKNPILFEHFTWTKVLDQNLKIGSVQTADDKIKLVTPEALEEYYNLLQDAARCFDSKRADLAPLLGEIIGLTSTLSILRSRTPLFATPNVVQIEGVTDSGVLIQLPLDEGFFDYPIKKGGRILLSGLGLGILKMIPGLIECENFQVDIHEDDPFTSRILKTIFSHLPFPYINLLPPRHNEFSGQGNLYDIAIVAEGELEILRANSVNIAPRGTVYFSGLRNCDQGISAVTERVNEICRETGMISKVVGTVEVANRFLGYRSKSEALKLNGGEIIGLLDNPNINYIEHSFFTAIEKSS